MPMLAGGGMYETGAGWCGMHTGHLMGGSRTLTRRKMTKTGFCLGINHQLVGGLEPIYWEHVYPI